jgi:hypothetical protein
MSRKTKLILVILAIVVCCVGITVGILTWIALDYGRPACTDSIIINNTTYDIGKLEIAGTTTNSSMAFSGFSYIENENCAYIRLRFVLVNRKFTSGDFDILSKNLSGIDYVYIQGCQKDDKKLIWKRNGQP